MVEEMNRVLEFIEANKDNLTKESVIAQIMSTYDCHKTVNNNSFNNVFAASQGYTFDLKGDGIIEYNYSRDTFGGNSSICESFTYKNIGSDVECNLVSINIEVIGDKKNKSTSIFDSEEKHNILSVIENRKSITKESVISWLDEGKVEADIYSNLDDNLKQDKDIINAIIDNIYNQSCSEFSEIRNYYMISPYGGEDITYFPDTEVDCFLDNINAKYQELNINMDEHEFFKTVHTFIFNHNSAEYIAKILSDYEKYSDIVNFSERNSDSIKNKFVEYESGIHKTLFDYENQIDCFKTLFIEFTNDVKTIKDDMVQISNKIAELQNNQYSLISRFILNKQYKQDMLELKNNQQLYHELSGQLKMSEDNLKNAQSDKNRIQEQYTATLNEFEKGNYEVVYHYDGNYNQFIAEYNDAKENVSELQSIYNYYKNEIGKNSNNITCYICADYINEHISSFNNMMPSKMIDRLRLLFDDKTIKSTMAKILANNNIESLSLKKYANEIAKDVTGEISKCRIETNTACGVLKEFMKSDIELSSKRTVSRAI